MRYVVTSKNDIIPARPIPIDDLTAPPFPRNHARILYDNKLISSVSPGADNTRKANSWERVYFSGNTNLTYSLDSNQSFDTVAIGGHNLTGATVRLYYDQNDSGMLRHLESRTLTSDAAIMFHFDTAYTAKRIQLRIEPQDSASYYVAYVSAGIALQLQRPFFAGHLPITDADQSDINYGRTQSGQIISNMLTRKGLSTSISVKNLNDAWVNQYFEPFRQAAKLKPFFFAWNLLQYPNDVGFCRTTEDIKTVYSGARNLHDVNFNLQGV